MRTLLQHRLRYPRIEPAPRELLWLGIVILATMAMMYGKNFLP